MNNPTPELLKDIVELSNSVPVEYRQKCFELLLQNALRSDIPRPLPIPGPPSPQKASPSAVSPFVVPIDVKAFLSQYGLNETVLWKFFLVEGAAVRPIYHLTATKKAALQTQISLLLALENALTNGQFQVSIEAVRTMAIDLKSYDGSNFMVNFKNNQKLFKKIDKDEPLVLSPDGKAELADLLEQMTADRE